MTPPDLNIFSAAAAKLRYFPEHLRGWLDGVAIAPVTLEIQPSEQCTHRCPQCQGHLALSRPEGKRRARSGYHLDLNTLSSIWEFPPSGIVLSGNTGDPLMHPDIGQLFGTLRSRRVPTVLITNGEFLSPAIAEQALLACRGIRVSLDAHDAHSFARTHGRRSDVWDKVIEGVANTVRIRAELGLKRFCRVGVGYLTATSTRVGMVGATELARKLGVDYIQFRPFHYDDTDITADLAICRDFETDGFRVLASDQKYSRISNRDRRYGRCHGAWFYSVIDARGDMYICCHHVGREEARIGSLRSHGWRELLATSERRRVIEGFPRESCVPLCRLHSHNEALERLARGTDSEVSAPMVEAIADHAPFL